MKFCYLCGKTGLIGGGYSNRVRATKFNPTGLRRRQPNLQWAVLKDGRRARICTRCLKRGKYLLFDKKNPALSQRLGGVR